LHKLTLLLLLGYRDLILCRLVMHAKNYAIHHFDLQKFRRLVVC